MSLGGSLASCPPHPPPPTDATSAQGWAPTGPAVMCSEGRLAACAPAHCAPTGQCWQCALRQAEAVLLRPTLQQRGLACRNNRPDSLPARRPLPARQPGVAPPAYQYCRPHPQPAVPRQASGKWAVDNSTYAVQEQCPTALLAPMMAAPPVDPDRQLGMYRVCNTRPAPPPCAHPHGCGRIRAPDQSTLDWTTLAGVVGAGPPPLPTFWRRGTPELTRADTKT